MVERIVLLDFIHRLVSQEQTKLRFFMSCEVCSDWVTYCHRCLTCFKGLCVYAPR
jgi:hypothetical protein